MYCFYVREPFFDDDETTGREKEIRLWCEDNWDVAGRRWTFTQKYELPYLITKFKLVYEKDATFFALKWGPYLYYA